MFPESHFSHKLPTAQAAFKVFRLRVDKSYVTLQGESALTTSLANVALDTFTVRRAEVLLQELLNPELLLAEVAVEFLDVGVISFDVHFHHVLGREGDAALPAFEARAVSVDRFEMLLEERLGPESVVAQTAFEITRFSVNFLSVHPQCSSGHKLPPTQMAICFCHLVNRPGANVIKHFTAVSDKLLY